LKIAFSYIRILELAPNKGFGAKWDPDDHPEPAVIEENTYHPF